MRMCSWLCVCVVVVGFMGVCYWLSVCAHVRMSTHWEDGQIREIREIVCVIWLVVQVSV